MRRRFARGILGALAFLAAEADESARGDLRIRPFDSTEGVRVREVERGSSAYKACLRKGDLILSLDGRRIGNLEDWTKAVESLVPGSSAEIEVLREIPAGSPDLIDTLKPTQVLRTEELPASPDGARRRKVVCRLDVSAAYRELPATVRDGTLNGFPPQDPLPLTGRAPEAGRLRAAVDGGLAFLLERQRPDGSWAFERELLYDLDALRRMEREGESSWEASNFQPTLLTSLCCLALRSHGAAPERIDAAVAKGLGFLLAAPEPREGRYGAWDRLFRIEFLCGELERAGDAPARGRIRDALSRAVAGLISDPGRGQRSRGGWGYNASSDEASFLTASARLALAAARAAGVPVPDEVLGKADRYLESLRRRSDDGEEFYAYSSGRAFGGLRGAMGRIAACELALAAGGRRDREDLSRALSLFLQHRGELDRVRGYPFTHHADSHSNAAYYYLYGHFYAARAARRIVDTDLSGRVRTAVQEAMLLTQQRDGAWLDHWCLGKIYGTAMALRALGEAAR